MLDSTQQIHQSLRRAVGKGQAERDGGARRTLETRTEVERLIQGEIDSTEMHQKRPREGTNLGEEEGGKHTAVRDGNQPGGKKMECTRQARELFREPVHRENVFV